MSDAPRRVQDPTFWDTAVLSLPHAHLLQSWHWGALKERYGWQAQRWLWHGKDGQVRAAAQLLVRRLPMHGLAPRLAVAYCPKGPLLDWSQAPLREQVLMDLQDLAAGADAIFLKIDPDLPLGFGYPGEPEAQAHALGEATAHALQRAGWRPSAEQIQFRNTMVLDLTLPEEALLAGMKQKTRYNVRLAARRGVQVRRGSLDDLDLLYRMYAETSLRDGFAIRHREYYRHAWGDFIRAGLAQPFIAEVEGQPVAALLLYRFGLSAWYLYGMSTPLHREKMPNHLLQWEAIRWAKAQGCTRYDLWGAPDTPNSEDPLWGVYRFKRGFGAQVVRTLGAWDLPLRPTFYWLYSAALPKLLNLMRARGRAQTRRLIE